MSSNAALREGRNQPENGNNPRCTDPAFGGKAVSRLKVLLFAELVSLIAELVQQIHELVKVRRRTGVRNSEASSTFS